MATDQPQTSELPEVVAPSEPAAAPAAPPVPAAEPDKAGFFWGTGRRKAAVARVRIRPGEGQFKINNRDFDSYFTELRDQNDVVAPLKLTSTEGQIDVFVNAKGGGYMGQAGAVVLGLSRALMRYDASLESPLRGEGMLSRDPRAVERQKPGQPGARRRFQFSKR